MASNYATARLLARLPSNIEVVQIADDIYAVKPTDVAAVRVLLSDQPQILYFLDRNVRADEVRINDDGERAWVLRSNGGAPRDTLSSLNSAFAKMVSIPATTEVTVKGFTVTSQYVELMGAGRYINNPDWLITKPLEVNVSPLVFGPYLVGGTRTVRGALPDSHVIPESPNNQISIVTVAEYDRVASEEQVFYKRSFEVTPIVNIVPKVNITLRKDLVMIAGPAVVDYAEIFPGFQWIVAGYGRIADRLEAVVSYMKQKDPNIDDAAFRKALQPMRDKSSATMILFKGSIDFDPVSMWPLARQATESGLANVPVDGEAVTVETRAKGLEDWKSGRWCLTVSDGSATDYALRARMAKGDLTDIAIKPSGPDVAHVSDGEGTIEAKLSSLVTMVFAYRKAGRKVLLLTSPFTDLPGFDRVTWAAVTAALTDPIPEVDTRGVDINDGDQGGLGEAICVRLLTPPQFTPEEESIVLPCLSPQYFWTDYARSVKVP